MSKLGWDKLQSAPKVFLLPPSEHKNIGMKVISFQGQREVVRVMRLGDFSRYCSTAGRCRVARSYSRCHKCLDKRLREDSSVALEDSRTRLHSLPVGSEEVL